MEAVCKCQGVSERSVLWVSTYCTSTLPDRNTPRVLYLATPGIHVHQVLVVYLIISPLSGFYNIACSENPVRKTASSGKVYKFFKLL